MRPAFRIFAAILVITGTALAYAAPSEGRWRSLSSTQENPIQVCRDGMLFRLADAFFDSYEPPGVRLDYYGQTPDWTVPPYLSPFQITRSSDSSVIAEGQSRNFRAPQYLPHGVEYFSRTSITRVSFATTLTAGEEIGADLGSGPDSLPVEDCLYGSAEADLTLKTADSADPAMPGDPFTRTTTIRNDGPDAATGVELELSPASAAASPSQGSCVHDSQYSDCALGTLAVGAEATVTESVTAAGGIAGDRIYNSATVVSDVGDPYPHDNVGNEVTDVREVDPPFFGAAANYGAGGVSAQVIADDFNGDLDPDLAVVHGNGPSTVSILLGGVGTSFGTATNFAVPGIPFNLTSGNFNGDSDPDLAVSNTGTDNVSILLGGAGGSFTSPTNYAVGSSPRSVAVGDFNGDLDPDLAVAINGSTNVSILLGGAGSTFGTATNFAAGSGPRGLVVADFNGDSDPDLAVTNELGGNVSILLGGAGGSFGAPTNITVGSVPFSVAVGNFNGDPDPDLAVANEGSDNVSVLLGATGGSFTGPTNYAVGDGPRSVAVGDFNGDPRPDLATGNINSDNVTVMVGLANGTFTGTTSFAAGDGARSVAVGGFDTDAYVDLAVANNNSSVVSILPGGPATGTGTIVVRKNTMPDHHRDFFFSAAGDLFPPSFSLDDDSDGTLSNETTYSNVPAGSGYSMSESVPAGWAQLNATCDDGSPVTNIDVSPGEVVTCTFRNVPLGYARAKGASPVNIRLVPAFNECSTGGTASHGGPLAVPSCNPPVQTSPYLTMNAPDRPAPFNAAALGGATITLKVTCLSSTNPPVESGDTPPCSANTGDQQDVKITTTLSGVRCVGPSGQQNCAGGGSPAGTLYNGKVLGLMPLVITDRLTGPAEFAATLKNFPFKWGIQCSAGDCNSTISADAVIPGLVKEGKRTTWELDEVEIRDGGSDGNLVAAPAPASGTCPPACRGNGGEKVFLTQGLFTP